MRYRVSELAVDHNGKYAITYVGNIVELGTPKWGTEMVLFDTLEDALTFIKSTVEKHLPEYVGKINEHM